MPSAVLSMPFRSVTRRRSIRSSHSVIPLATAPCSLRGVAQDVSDHGVAIGRRVRREKARDRFERAGAVVIVRVDHRERFADGVPAHENRVAGAPRLGAVRRQGKIPQIAFQFLVDVIRRHETVEFAADDVLERGLETVADDEDDFAESCSNRVVNGIVDEGLAMWPDRVDLLKPAVPGAQACRQNQQRRFHATPCRAARHLRPHRLNML